MKTAVILAGGFGTRLRSLVSDRPKPMALIGDRPFLQYLLDYWITQGISRFVLSVGYMSSVIIEFFGEFYRGCQIIYSVEEKPLGTGGAVLLASKLLQSEESFLLLNGDTFFPIELSDLEEFHERSNSKCTFSLFISNEDDRFMGIKVDGQGRILELNSEKGVRGEYANGGVYIIDSSLLIGCPLSLRDAPISLETDFFKLCLLQNYEFYGLPCLKDFIDIGLPHDYLRAKNLLINSMNVFL
jgi:D-glycero-alpha-D-manno-heptose 1-phosphate guanylyltransferase